MGQEEEKDSSGGTYWSLSGKQRAFVDTWFGEAKFNATQAARLAGYGNEKSSDEYYRLAGHRAITNDNVQSEIKRRWAAHGMTADEVVGRLSQMARADISTFVTETGAIDWKVVKAQGQLIKKILHTKGKQSQIELYDAQSALEKIARTMGLFTDRVDVTSGDKPLTVVFAGLKPDDV